MSVDSQTQQQSKKRWMIFRTEGSFIYYIWSDGMPHPAVFSLPNGFNPDPYYWMGNGSNVPAMPNQEKQILMETNRSKKIIMTFPGRPKQRFVVEARGDINQE